MRLAIRLTNTCSTTWFLCVVKRYMIEQQLKFSVVPYTSCY